MHYFICETPLLLMRYSSRHMISHAARVRGTIIEQVSIHASRDYRIMIIIFRETFTQVSDPFD